MERLTNSQLSSFRACRRLHYYRAEVCRLPIFTPRPLAFGTMSHLGLEAWWKEWSDRDPYPLEAAIEAAQKGFYSVSGEAELDECDLVRVEEVLRGYHFRWCDQMADVEALAVEAEFNFPLVNPMTGAASKLFTLAGKLDVVFRQRSTGEVWFLEHKNTTSNIEPGSDYWTRLRMDSQISTYYDGCESLGWKPVGCIYDVLARPTIKRLMATPEDQREYTKGKPCICTKDNVRQVTTAERCECGGSRWKEAPRIYKGQREEDESMEDFRLRVRADIAENPNAYYQRAQVPRLESDLDGFRFDTWLTAQSLRAHQRDGRKYEALAWPRNPDACLRWNRFCEYYDVCSGCADIADPRFRTGRKHEELTEGKE